MKRRMSEQELAEKVIEWLIPQHWEVYQEVRFHRYIGIPIADIVCVRNNLLWIIECKTSFSLDVLEQASAWRCHFRSIAVPSIRRGRGDRTRWRKRQKRGALARDYYKVGVIEVSSLDVTQDVAPVLMREYHRFSKYLIDQLCEEQKEYAKAGTKGGGYYTPYQKTIRRVKKSIQTYPGCTLLEIMNRVGTTHYHTPQAAKSSLRLALDSWESVWCEVIRDGRINRYYIRDKPKEK